jgi:glutamate mutase epsilon subunit
MSENWSADARVGVPMMQVIAKQISQCKDRPRAVRQIIDQQWLDEASKEQLREMYHVTDADLAAHEREAAIEARRETRERYGIPVPTGPCDCDAEPVVHPSGRIDCQQCGAEWTAPDVRQIIDAQWLDEASKEQLRERFRVTDDDLLALKRSHENGQPGPEHRAAS